MNILFCSAGRRVELLKDFKSSLGDDLKIVVTDNSRYAPALYVADKQYLVPLIYDEEYISTIINICKKEKIDVVTTLIDPEIEILAKNRKLFDEINVLLLTPDELTAQLCFDKYKMYQYLVKNQINTVKTYANLNDFNVDFKRNNVIFPVFVKPRTGSGSVGAKKLESYEELINYYNNNENMIIQEYMDGIDLDADVYVDTISHQPVSIFSKRKIETKIGGANKTVSFKDEKLFDFIRKVIPLFKFYGPIDMDFFYKDDEYYLSEINPRFGGAYLHAYGAGVDFTEFIKNNVNGIVNESKIGRYDEGVVMLMFDSIIIKNEEDLVDA